MTTAYCFDFDGTITEEELLPLVAKECGIYEEIKLLTDYTINGIIPFEKSFMLRCKLLKDVPISRVQKIVKSIRINNKISSFIKNNSQNCFIITGNLNVWVEPLLKTFACEYFCAEAEFIDDTLIKPIKLVNKGEIVKQLRSRFKKIIAIGDGMGDISMFEQSDIKVAYAKCHPPIKTLIALSDFIIFNENTLCRLLKML